MALAQQYYFHCFSPQAQFSQVGFNFPTGVNSHCIGFGFNKCAPVSKIPRSPDTLEVTSGTEAQVSSPPQTGTSLNCPGRGELSLVWSKSPRNNGPHQIRPRFSSLPWSETGPNCNCGWQLSWAKRAGAEKGKLSLRSQGSPWLTLPIITYLLPTPWRISLDSFTLFLLRSLFGW